ncbi:MAG: LuxR family transcriptional regulator, partial [Acidimicrobiaceae bacterium]
MVVVAAPAVDEVVARIRRELEAGDEIGGESGVGSKSRTVDVARASRTDRARPGSLRNRRPAGWFAADRPTLIVSDLQWADDESLDDLAAAADVMPEGKWLVVVHSTPVRSRSLAVVHQVAKRRGAVIDIGPSDAGEIAALLGIELDRASEVFSVTEGLPDLVVALLDDGTIGVAITERLSVLDDATRWTAELIAFGATRQRLPALSGLEPDELDRTMTELAIEGIVHGGRMIPAVAEAVRRSATAARRSRVIRAIVELDEPGSHDDLASILLDLDDRSDAAGELYGEVAESSADADPAAADQFLAAARRCGIDTAALALTEARIGLSTGDVTRSLRALHAGEPGAAAELVLASALVSIGDFESAAIALARSPLAELGGWAAAGLGRMPGRESSPTAAGSVGAATEAWLADDADRAFDQLKRASIRFAAEVEPDSWPATPHLIQAVIAAKFGDLAAAERAVEAAVDEQTTGRLHHRSHLLMLAWLAARRGRLDDATATLQLVTANQLTPQQRLWRAAVECAIAVRDPEAASVGSAVDSAIDAIDGVGTHLYDIEIVGDAAAAATRA